MTCTLMKFILDCPHSSMPRSFEVLNRHIKPWSTPPVTGALRMHQGEPEARLRGNPPQSPP
eukprot:3150082-Karenia_brevis.AAC.1